MSTDMKEILEKEIELCVNSRAYLFRLLMENEIPKVGTVIIQKMNEDTAIILTLKKILRESFK